MKMVEKLVCIDTVGCDVGCEEGFRFIVVRIVDDLVGFTLGAVIVDLTVRALVGGAEGTAVSVGLEVRALLGLTVGRDVRTAGALTGGVLVGVAVGVVGCLVGESVGPDGASVGRAVGLEGAAEGTAEGIVVLV